MNTFGSRSTLRVGDKEYEIYRIDALDKQGISTAKLPYSMRILLENLLRREDGKAVTAATYQDAGNVVGQEHLRG